MNTLIIYATYSGGTEAAANILNEELKTKGQTVDLKNPPQAEPADFAKYDLVVLASPSWDTDGKDGQPHEDFFPFMEKAKGLVPDGKKFAVMGLGDSSYPHFCGAADVLEKFISDNKGMLAVPSLRIDGFFYDQDKHTREIKDWANKLG
jgi:flavodoxin I